MASRTPPARVIELTGGMDLGHPLFVFRGRRHTWWIATDSKALVAVADDDAEQRPPPSYVREPSQLRGVLELRGDMYGIDLDALRAWCVAPISGTHREGLHAAAPGRLGPIYIDRLLLDRAIRYLPGPARCAFMRRELPEGLWLHGRGWIAAVAGMKRAVRHDYNLAKPFKLGGRRA